MNTRHIDWYNELRDNYENWTNHGRSLQEENCNHKTQDKEDCEDKENKECDCCETNLRYSGYCEECGVCEDDCQPMMNYGYLLETVPSEEAILKVCEETNCTVMYNEEEDAYYLALCGGGMDLSQDIALAYNIIERWVPYDLALSVCTQPDFSQYGSKFRKVMRACRESIKNRIGHGKMQITKINESITKSLAKNKKD